MTASKNPPNFSRGSINKIYIFALMILLAPITCAEPTSFVLADAMPQNITGGTITGANYTLFYSDPVYSVFIFSMHTGNNFSDNMTDYPLRNLTLDGVVMPDCVELVQDNFFLKTCDVFVGSGEHTIGVLLQPAVAIAPDVIEYSLTVLYGEEAEEYTRSSRRYYPYNITIHKATNDTIIEVEEPINETPPIEPNDGYSEPTEPDVLKDEVPEKEYDYGWLVILFFLLFMFFYVLLAKRFAKKDITQEILGR